MTETSAHAVDAAAHAVSLHARLAAVPAGAEIRGVFHAMLDEALQNDPVALASYTERFPGRLRSYAAAPLHDYLCRLALVGRLLGPTVEGGIARVFEHAASLLLASSALKHFVRLRDRDPWVMIQRLERSRALISSHGEWRVHGRRGDAIIDVRDELVWLDTAWTTAIASIFPALELPRAEVTCSLRGPFDGTIRVRW